MRLEELASPSPSIPQSSRTPIPSSTLVEYLDYFILVVILTFSLFNAPRALVYIANNRSQLFQGYFLHSTTHFRMYRSPSETAVRSEEKRGGTQGYTVPTLGPAVPVKQWHFPMHLSLRHPAAAFMHYHLLGNYTVVQILLMAGYTAAVLYIAFYESNPFRAPVRAGWVITSQIPFVYAFATKNNVIGLLVGVGYEKLNYLHRHVGRLMVIGANVHAIGFIYKWTLAGNVSKRIAEPFIRWGIVALICFDLLGFFSIHSVRMNSYNLFFGTHVVGLIVFLFAACLHEPACIPYVIAASAVYGLDHVIRAIKTHFTAATLRTIPELGLTRVDIPSLSAGWRPGQHVRLRVLSTAMGLFGMTEVHPFTISSATHTEDGLTLMCKRTGKWTKKLYEIAQTTGSAEQGQKSGRKVNVMIEGPYGGVGDTTVPNYSGAMFVAGGSGVTFALSAVQDLLLAGDRSRTQIIDVVWSISDPAALEHFLPLFATLVSQSGPTQVRILVFHTRITTRPFEGLILPPGITLTPGRPDMKKLLGGFLESMTSNDGAYGAFVAVCGPISLSQDVARAVRTCHTDSKRAVGGIQYHEEVFGW